MWKGGFDLLVVADTVDSRAFVELAAVLGHTCGHADRDFVRKLPRQASWIGECDIQVDMDAAYALLPSGPEVLSLEVSATFPQRASAFQTPEESGNLPENVLT